MGPNEESLELADRLIRKFNLSVNRIDFAYEIMHWADGIDIEQGGGEV